MRRRRAIQLSILLTGGTLATLLFHRPLAIWNKILGRIKLKLSPPSIVPETERKPAELPKEGYLTTIETALNSRCNSDYTGNQKYLHWGMFDEKKKLTPDQIHSVVELSNIPRYTNQWCGIIVKGSWLIFGVENVSRPLLRESLMIENGMLQQSVSLICAALGIGMKFQNMGRDGKALDNGKWGTVKFKLAPMRPSYNGLYWSNSPPKGPNGWINGNLPEPDRKGTKPLISLLPLVEKEGTSPREASKSDISQLLWAARGRTPHYYKSKPWGMTIPFWSDKIVTTKLYLLTREAAFEYVNWQNGHATHSVKKIIDLKASKLGDLLTHNNEWNYFIVISQNDPHARALWEVGYQLYNILTQSTSLGLAFESRILWKAERRRFSRLGIKHPVALVGVR